MNQQTGLRLMRVPHSLVRNRHSSRPSQIALPNRIRIHQAVTTPLSWRRHASNNSTAAASASAAATAKTSKAAETEAVLTPLDAATASTPEAATYDPDVDISTTLNPPASTRPPPLDLPPPREPDASAFGYYFRLGKAYMTFYKTGLRAIFTNRKLLSELNHVFQGPPGLAKQPAGASSSPIKPTRAAVLLRERTSHDLARLPIFGVLVVVFGEFTPLVVLVFPKLTPLTCRIPKQTEKLRAKMQARREASRKLLRHVDPQALEKLAPGHIVRSLGLGLSLWDKVGVDPPFARVRADRAVRRLVADDFSIRDGGGVDGLVEEEVVMACEDRGMDVTVAGEQSVAELRKKLAGWIEETTAKGEAEGEAAVRRILMRTGQ